VVAVTPVLGAWILDPIYKAMGTVLAFFYSIVPSYGLAIILLTMTVRIFLIPLTTKQVRSQQAMQRIQPELKRLQAKYKNDRQKLNEEMMKFYKENKVNPVAGCLPILLQAPLFLVLYRLILGLNNKPRPKNLPVSSELYTSLLGAGGKMVSAGVDLARSASTVKGLGTALPYYVLIAITVATGYYQQRQMSSRLPKDSVNAQMQMIGKVFPIVFGFISFSLPAGVVLYFIVSNVWQVGQQALTFRKFPPPPAAGGGNSTAASSQESGHPKSGPNGKRPPGKPGGNGKGPRSSGPSSGERPTSGPGGRPSSTAKGKRPPPSPRPKGLPHPGGKPGQKGSTSAKNSRRKDT